MQASPLATAHHYRPDIDGLRAIAVSLVLVFHAFPERLPGGFVGVDVFFVISGYLISGLIFADLRKERFSFLDFYGRRIRRIFPALILVLTVSFLLGWFLLLPDEYSELGKHVAGGAGFVSNFVLLGESGYFDSAAELKPLLHLWSLGIEEQFYFVWPLLLYFAWGRRRWAPLGLILLLLVGSFALNIDRVHDQATSTYYLPFTRFWELMIGCTLAYISPLARERQWFAFGRPQALVRLRNGAALAGLAAIVVAAILIDKEQAFPGWRALLPTLGAFLLIAAGPTAWINRIVLAHPLMVFVGLISFPLYLWHWPLLSFPRITSVDPPSPELRAAALGLSVFLAWLTYRLIERPIRFHSKQAQVVPVLGGLMALLVVAGYGTYLADGIAARMKDKAEYSAFFGWNYTISHNLMVEDRHECNFYDIINSKIKPAIDSSCYTPHSDKVVFLWGDSHAQHLNYGLKHSLPDDVSLLQVGSSGCAPSVVNHDHDALGTCNRANRFALEKIAAIKPDTVILAQSLNHEDNDFDGLATELKEVGVDNIVLVGPVPQWQPSLFKLILKNYWGAVPLRLNNHQRQSVFKTDQLMKERYGNSLQITYISLVDRLCNADGCLTYLDGNPKEGLITYDYGHFTLPASRYVVQNFITPVLERQMVSSHQPIRPFPVLNVNTQSPYSPAPHWQSSYSPFDRFCEVAHYCVSGSALPLEGTMVP
ncbi:MAG: acyltransferase family protein [Desulfoprunum sp.]|nr:acyltransferase family protein [Desulfoprunum sp.]